MALSNDLVSQFAKIINSDKKSNAETTVYGEVVIDGNGDRYVKLDGSDQLTPIDDGSTSAKANNGERVTVLIKDHTAIVTGNVSSPAARTGDVEDLDDQVQEIKKFDIILADRVEANEGYIKTLQIDKASVGELKAAEAKITELEAKDVEITGELTAAKATITDLETTKLDAEVANVKFAEIENLKATKAEVRDLEADFGTFRDLTTEELEANEATINRLEAENVQINETLIAHEAVIGDLDATFAKVEALNATNAKISELEAEDVRINGTLIAQQATLNSLDAKYANIDFSNIKMAAVEELFTKSGIIKDLVVGDTSITGELVGVTLKGDLIEAGTVKADKLVVKGSDGVFYKLNVEAGGISAEKAPQDSLHGSVIAAKSITAEKVNVKDLVAFGATIGGFKLTENSFYSGSKESVQNTTTGIYQDSSGQFAVGDGTQFLKFYKQDDGTYKLELSASSIKISSSNKTVETMMDDAQSAVDKVNKLEERADAGEFNGEDATVLRIDSSRGTVFKNNAVSTVLSAVIYKGSKRITDITALKEEYGDSAYIEWSWQKLGENAFGVILSTDKRIGQNGFTFTLSPEDVDTKVVFMCQLVTE